MLKDELYVSRYVAAWLTCPFAEADDHPWKVIQAIEQLLLEAISGLESDYHIEDHIAVHKSSVIENGSVIKGPAIIGPDCFVASGAYLRGGAYLEKDCIIGPGSELKTCFMFSGSKIAHLNFVGDSILGSNVNVEAGAIIANYRNELANKAIRILVNGNLIETGVDKFGALVGDGSRIGANAVVAPGALIASGTKIGRLALFDQYPY